MPSPHQQSQALLRIMCLVLAVFLFIAMTEQDARHETHQRWLAEARRRQEAGLIATSTSADRFAHGTVRTYGSYGSASPSRTASLYETPGAMRR